MFYWSSCHRLHSLPWFQVRVLVQASSPRRCSSIVMNPWKMLLQLEQCVIHCSHCLHAHYIFYSVILPVLHPLRQVQIPAGFFRIFLTKSTLFLESGCVLRQLDYCTGQIHGRQIYHRVLVLVLPCFVGLPAHYLGDRMGVQKSLVFSLSKQKVERRILGVDCYYGVFGTDSFLYWYM